MGFPSFFLRPEQIKIKVKGVHIILFQKWQRKSTQEVLGMKSKYLCVYQQALNYLVPQRAGGRSGASLAVICFSDIQKAFWSSL